MALKQALQEAIINFDDQAILDQLGYKGFLATDNFNYDEIRLLNNVYKNLGNKSDLEQE